MTGISSIGQVVNGFQVGATLGKGRPLWTPAAFVLLFMVLLLLLRDRH
jgi:hypothetical protein